MKPAQLVRLGTLAAWVAALLVSGPPARAADPGDEFWTPAYSPAGVQGTVDAMLSRPGILYIGGSFNAVRGQPIGYIAALTTSTETGMTVTDVRPLGDGLDNYVTALCEHGGDLVAVGAFTASGAQTLERVGRWDGAAWRPLGEGLPGKLPRAAASYLGDLYAGAMRWDGETWSNALQTNGTVTSLVVHDGLLFVGGDFTGALGEAVPYLFAWDGAQMVTLVDGFPYPVKSMTSAPDGLYVSGFHDFAGGQVARWDGATWNVEIPNPWIAHLATYAGDVYASTVVTTVPHFPSYKLQSNAGGTWHQVATVFPEAMVEHDGLLIVQADPGDDATLLTPGLAAFDGGGLQDVFEPPAGYAQGFQTFAPYGAGLIVGGSYTIANGQRIAGSALKIGDTWFPAGSPADIPSGYPAVLEELVAVGTDIFAVYRWVDWDVSVDVLAKLAWVGDGFHWQPLDTPYGYAGLLQPVGSQLFSIGGGYVRSIDPATGAYTDLTPFAANGGVYDTCEAAGALTICGSFSTVNGVAVGNVARYVGGVWEGVGDPLPGYRVQAVTGLEGSGLAAAIWIDGVFRVWVFDGSAWSVLPGDFAGSVDHLVYHRGRLFAAGSFDQVGVVRAPGVAIWTGDQWATVGSGLRGGSYRRVNAVLSHDDKLFFAGTFIRAGGVPSVGFAEWSGDPTLFEGLPAAVPGTGPATRRFLETARPNPFNPRTEIAFVAPGGGRVRVGIYDLRGRRVRELVDEDLAAGRHLRTWDGRDDAGRAMPSGVYLVRLRVGDVSEALKLTLAR
jgi:hypothetical protein